MFHTLKGRMPAGLINTLKRGVNGRGLFAPVHKCEGSRPALRIRAGARWLAGVVAVFGIVLTASAQPSSPVQAAVAKKVKKSPAAQSQQKSLGSEVFGPTNLHKLHLMLSVKEWEAMQNTKGPNPFGRPDSREEAAAITEPGDRDTHQTGVREFPWAHADLMEEGRTYTNVAVRYKGSFTFMASMGQLKRSFKLEFDHYDKDAPRFHGLRKFNLHAGIMDPTRVHEALSYAIFRWGGVAAPRTAFAEVTLTVPGKYDRELLGLFTLTEQVDKQFLKDRFGDAQGLLMKPQLRGPDYFGERWDAYKDRYRPHRDPTPQESRQIMEFASLVNRAGDEDFRRQIGSVLELEAFLRFLAINALVVNLDSPLAMPQNYYLYLDVRTHKFTFFPWDLDLGLASWPMGGSPEDQMNLSLLHPHIGDHKLIDRVLGIPTAKEQYLRLLNELAAGAFAKQRLLEGVAAIEQTTQKALAREGQAKAARHEERGGFGPPGMGMPAPTPRTFVEKRTESVAAQLSGKSHGYVPTMPFWPGGGPGGGPGRGPMGPPGGGPNRPDGPPGPPPPRPW